MYDGLGPLDKSIEEIDRMDRKEVRRQKDKMMRKNKKDDGRIETKYYKRKRKNR